MDWHAVWAAVDIKAVISAFAFAVSFVSLGVVLHTKRKTTVDLYETNRAALTKLQLENIQKCDALLFETAYLDKRIRDLSGRAPNKGYRSDDVAAWFTDSQEIRQSIQRYRSVRGNHDEFSSVPYSKEADRGLRKLRESADEMATILGQLVWQQSIARAKDLIDDLDDRTKRSTGSAGTP
jgi:hypothetical protein